MILARILVKIEEERPTVPRTLLSHVFKYDNIRYISEFWVESHFTKSTSFTSHVFFLRLEDDTDVYQLSYYPRKMFEKFFLRMSFRDIQQFVGCSLHYKIDHRGIPQLVIGEAGDKI